MDGPAVGDGLALGAGLAAHTLLSSAHVERYLLLLRSLAVHAVAVEPVVHDDGTLTAADVAAIGQAAPTSRVISRAEADEAAATILSGHPWVRRLREHNVRITQLVDYHLFARRPRILAVDSDVIFLRRPDEIIDWVRQPTGTGAAVAYSPENGWQPKGIHWLPDAVPDRPFVTNMCCGFVAVDAPVFLDLDYLEDLVARTDPRVRQQQRFVTQMYYALMTGRLPAGGVQDLGERYRSGRLEWLPDIDDRAVCHYFGSHDEADAIADIWRRRPDLRQAVGG